MLFTHETLNEVVGFNICDDSFFSEGTELLLDGKAWTVEEICGDQIIVKAFGDLETARENMDFFFQSKLKFF